MVGRAGGAARLIPGMMTIQAFERRLYQELAGPRQMAGGFLRSLLLSKVLQDIYGKDGAGGVFAGAWRFPGFIHAMLELFDQLGAGMVRPADLQKISGYAPAKEKEIISILVAYEEQLGRLGAEDGAMAHRGLIERINRAGTTPFLARFSSIDLEDIYQFTPYRFELFRALARRHNVRIFAPAPDSRRGAFGFLTDNLSKFEELGDEAGKLEIQFTQSSPGPLENVKRWIFEMDPDRQAQAMEEKPPVTILCCSSRYREIEEIGRRILRSKKQAGWAWSDFILVMRETGPYAAIVEDVFGRYSIPFFMKKGIPLSQAPLVRAALSGFVAIDSNFAREDILRMVCSSYFPRFQGLDPAMVGKLFVSAGVMDGPPERWKELINAALKRWTGDGKRNLELIAVATGELLGRLERLKAARGASEFLDSYAGLLDWLGLAPPPTVAGPLGPKILFRDNNSHLLFSQVMQEAADEAKKIGRGASGLGYGRMRDILLSALDGRSMPEPGAADRNRVQALNVFDVVGIEAREVFICGLHEGEFPQRGRAGAILTEIEKEKFNRKHFESVILGRRELGKGRRVFDSPSDKWNEESLLFFQAIRAAGEQLHLSYCVQELDGSPLMRSLFIDDMLEALAPGQSLSQRERLILTAQPLAISGGEELADPEEARMKLLRDMFQGQAPGEELEPRIAAMAGQSGWWDKFRRLVFLAAMERGRDAYFAETDPAAKARLGGPYCGEISGGGDLVKKIMIDREHGRYSPTALEAYGRCPFRYFAGRLLGLELERKPDLRLEAREAGSMIHQIVESFYRKLIAQKKLPLQNGPYEKRILHGSAEAVFRKMRLAGALPEPAVWEPEEEKIMAMLERWLAAEAVDQTATGFMPVAVELEFDFPWRKKDAFEPLLIMAPCQGARYLYGAIDRLDINLAQSAIRVVDYKSGSNAAKYGKLLDRQAMGTLSFQQPVYSLLSQRWVLERGLMPKVERVAASYRLLAEADHNKAYVTAGHGAKGKEPFFDGDFLGGGPGAEDRPGTFENLTISMILRLEDGHFPVEPRDCEYCDFAGLCRYIATPRGGPED